jgi:hypothetical protein
MTLASFGVILAGLWIFGTIALFLDADNWRLEPPAGSTEFDYQDFSFDDE